MDVVDFRLAALLAGELVLLAGLTWLALRLRGERAAREAALAELAENQAVAEDRTLRLALLDRRRAVIAPVERLRLDLSEACSPDPRLIAEVHHALAEARFLFAECEALGRAEDLLRNYRRNRDWQHAAVAQGRHGDRIELLEEAGPIVRELGEALARLSAELAAAARVQD